MDEQNQTRRTDKGKQILGRSIGDRPGTSSNHVASAPVAVYGFVLLMAAIAYSILQWAIIALEGRESLLAAAIGAGLEGQTLVRALPGRNPAGVRESVDCDWDVCGGRIDVAGSRPAD